MRTSRLGTEKSILQGHQASKWQHSRPNLSLQLCPTVPGVPTVGRAGVCSRHSTGLCGWAGRSWEQGRGLHSTHAARRGLRLGSSRGCTLGTPRRFSRCVHRVHSNSCFLDSAPGPHFSCRGAEICPPIAPAEGQRGERCGDTLSRCSPTSTPDDVASPSSPCSGKAATAQVPPVLGPGARLYLTLEIQRVKQLGMSVA